jgi:hypothetical protein
VVGNQPRSFGRALAVLVPFICIAAAGLMIYGFNQAHEVNAALMGWGGTAIAIALLGTAASRLVHRANPTPAMPAAWVVLAITSIAGFQALFATYNQLPKTRSARELARTVSTAVAPGAALFTVSHYRQSMGFYLARTLQVYDFRGELEFGLGLAQGGRNDLDAFRSRWETTTDGIAFIDPKSWSKLDAAGMPGRVIGNDGRSVAVSRR